MNNYKLVIKSKSFLQIIFVLFFLFFYLSGFSQPRHMNGIKSAELNFGLTKTGKTISGYYSQYFNSKLYFKGGLKFEYGSFYNYSCTSLDLIGNYTILKIKNVTFLNASIGLNISRFNSQNNNATKGGALFGTEIETYLNDNFILLLNCKENVMTGKAFGYYKFLYGIGIKYAF